MGKILTRQNIIFLFYILIITSLVFSKYLISVFTFFMAFMVMLTRDRKDGKYFRLGIQPILYDWNNYKIKHKHFLYYTLFIVWIFVSILWSHDSSGWLHELNSKLNLLVVPILIVWSPPVSRQKIFHMHVWLYLLISFSNIISLTLYMNNFDFMNLLIKLGRSIPTPLDHIRFSMINVYLTLSGIYYLSNSISSKTNKYLVWFVTILSFVTLHIFAVRSGLLLTYIGLFIYIIYILSQKRSLLLTILSFTILVIVPLIAIKKIPSLNQKFNYTKYSFQQWKINSGNLYSDNDRIKSIQLGIELFQKSPIIGHGAGDYKEKYRLLFSDKNILTRFIYPHNQYIRTAIGVGIIGVILLVFALVFPIFIQERSSLILIIMLSQIYIVSFLFEANFERYSCMSFYIYFVSWLSMLNYSPSIQES